MQDEYKRLIAELDKTLLMVSSLWFEAEDAGERNKWRIRLDELLAERLRLMRCRDACSTVVA